MFPTRQWIGLAVESSVGWPSEKTFVDFEGHKLELQPGSADESPSVVVGFDIGAMTDDEAHELLRRYLSALSWTEGRFIRDLFRLGGPGGGVTRIKFGRALPLRVTAMHFMDRVHPVPADPRAALAVALYREALGAVTIPYQVLGFAKILNIVKESGKQQKAWITSALPLLRGEAAKRMGELQASGTDVAHHVYGSCRCAIAHAFDPTDVVNPDSFADDRRLEQDLPLVRELAELVMTRELGLKR